MRNAAHSFRWQLQKLKPQKLIPKAYSDFSRNLETPKITSHTEIIIIIMSTMLLSVYTHEQSSSPLADCRASPQELCSLSCWKTPQAAWATGTWTHTANNKLIIQHSTMKGSYYPWPENLVKTADKIFEIHPANKLSNHHYLKFNSNKNNYSLWVGAVHSNELVYKFWMLWNKLPVLLYKICHWQMSIHTCMYNNWRESRTRVT